MFGRCSCTEQLRVVIGMLRDFSGALETLDRKLDKIMTAQSDIDAATAALTGIVSDVAANVGTLVNTDIPAIQAEIAKLQGQGVDTTALNAAVASATSTASSLDSAVADVGSIPPAPAAP